MAKKITDIPSHFFSKVNKEGPGGCWLWTGNIDSGGYGRFKANNRQLYAHRWSYEYHKEEIPKWYEIDHLCRVRNCVNPNHLEAVTGKVNRDRAKERRTHCKHGHPFDEANTAINCYGHRVCLTCRGTLYKTPKKPVARFGKRPFLRDSA